MINHVRTLLLNCDGNHGYGYDYPGEEFVLPTFRAKAVPTFLNGALRMLFGSNPDRLFLNCRMRQIMSLLHSTELEEFVLLPDSRVTYWPMVDDGFAGVFTNAAEQYLGPYTRIFVIGAAAADDGAGKSELQWKLRYYSSGQDYIEITRQIPVGAPEVIELTFTDSLSEEVPLPGGTVRFRIEQPIVSGVEWIVTVRSKPAIDFGVTLQKAIQLIGQSGIDNLFLSTVEPIPTLKVVWETHPLFAYRYSAMLLAVAYYLDGTAATGGTVNIRAEVGTGAWYHLLQQSILLGDMP